MRVSLFLFGRLNFNLKLIFAHVWKIGVVALSQFFAKLSTELRQFPTAGDLASPFGGTYYLCVTKLCGTWQRTRMAIGVGTLTNAGWLRAGRTKLALLQRC